MPHNLMRAARFHEYGPPESLVQCPYQACLAHDPPPKRRIDAVLGHRGRTDEVPPAVFCCRASRTTCPTNLFH